MRSVRCWLVFFVILGVCPTAAFADPVDLLLADTQAFVQDSGAMDVIYRLTFRDNEGRSAIRKIGPFYQPLHFTRAMLHHGDDTSSVVT